MLLVRCSLVYHIKRIKYNLLQHIEPTRTRSGARARSRVCVCVYVVRRVYVNVFGLILTN